MSELKVNSIKGTGASTAAITIDSSSGACSANITNNLTNRNLIINGAMQVAQRGTSSTTSGYGSVDRWNNFHNGTDEAPTQSQVDVASGTTPYTSGFRKALRMTNGNQTGGAGAGDYIAMQHNIEAQNLATSGWNYTSTSSFITLSFWIKSSVAQSFKGYLRTSDGTKQVYPFDTGSLSADTWTKITKTVSGNSNIQIDNDNGGGFQVNIVAFWGTDGTASSVTENAWQAYSDSARMKDNTSTWYTTNDATLEITGVQLEVGQIASDFEHRTFEDDFQKCLRYYEQMSSYGLSSAYFAVGYNESTTQCNHALLYKTYKRATPTITTNGDSNFKNHNTGTSVALSNLSIQGQTPQSARCEAISGSSVLTDGGCSVLSSFDTDDAIIKIDAEL
jgi:hypothetical protein